jgi:hypothetical protein
MRAVSLEEVSQGHRAVRRPAGMLALHCSPVALDKAPMARYGQAKQGIRPDLEVGLSPVVTRDGRDLPAGAILCGELAATRFAVGGAERPGRNGLRRWRHPSWLGGDRALRSRQTTSTFRIPAGTGKHCIGMCAPVGLPGPDWPALRTCTKVRTAGIDGTTVPGRQGLDELPAARPADGPQRKSRSCRPDPARKSATYSTYRNMPSSGRISGIDSRLSRQRSVLSLRRGVDGTGSSNGPDRATADSARRLC